jgi:glycosyltransferase involved in cell wall biosynthesis
MKKVLMVAYSYPPVGGIGVLRTLKFTKYLPQFGFAPVVLTRRNPPLDDLDPTLLEEVPKEVKVIAAASAEQQLLRAARRPARLLGVKPEWFFVPGVHIGWLPFAVRAGEAIIREEDIDVIFATAPVTTSLLIGYVLKRRTRKPLVLDFRDPWTQNVFTTYPTRVHRRLQEKMESVVLRSADHVVTTTKEMSRGLIDKYPFLRDRCATITNGFDSSDFRDLRRSASSERFTITYAGSLYGLQTAPHFLAALGNLMGTRRDLRDKIRVVFVGHKNWRTVRLVQELGLEHVVEMNGFVAHRESLQWMLNADVLLLVMGQREAMGNGLGPMRIPGKTFEYLATRRPILALVPPGAAADLIRETGSGMVVPPEEVGAIERAILDMFDRWQAGTLSVTPYDVSGFERCALTAKLATVFESLCRADQRIN